MLAFRYDRERVAGRVTDEVLCFWCGKTYTSGHASSRSVTLGACVQLVTGRYFCCQACWERYLETQRRLKR